MNIYSLVCRYIWEQKNIYDHMSFKKITYGYVWIIYDDIWIIYDNIYIRYDNIWIVYEHIWLCMNINDDI